jgi:hypothetical protein
MQKLHLFDSDYFGLRYKIDHSTFCVQKLFNCDFVFKSFQF